MASMKCLQGSVAGESCQKRVVIGSRRLANESIMALSEVPGWEHGAWRMGLAAKEHKDRSGEEPSGTKGGNEASRKGRGAKENTN
jgi:hypothetical protein